MRKCFVYLLIIIILIPGTMQSAHAHDSQAEHDRDLKQVLFGIADYSLCGEKYDAFRAMADATALCIDQFSANEHAESKKRDFEDLSRKVHLSFAFKDIDLNKGIDGKSITANTHRMYTHKGWNFSEYPDKELWKRRKKLMLDTAQQKIFNNSSSIFSWLTDTINSWGGPSEQCDAFCAMVYYVHILGDHLEGDKPSKLTALEPLAQYESLSSPGIIPELQEYLQVLFVDQKNTRTYMALMQDLDVLGREAEKVYYSWGGINTEEKCAINMDNAKALLKLLGDKVPILLRNEDFFKQVFL